MCHAPRSLLALVALSLLATGCRDRQPEAAPTRPAPTPMAPTQQLSGVAERMKDPAHLEALKAFSARQREQAMAIQAVRVQLEARQGELSEASDEARAATAKIAALRETIAAAEAGIAAQEEALRALAGSDGRWRELADEMKAAQAVADDVQREMREWMGAEMRRQAQARTNTVPTDAG